MFWLQQHKEILNYVNVYRLTVQQWSYNIHINYSKTTI